MNAGRAAQSSSTAPVTMSLNPGFEGPGTMSPSSPVTSFPPVLESSIRQRGSFQVPTCKHSSWVFTAEPLHRDHRLDCASQKNGQQVSSESVLHFTVGNPDNNAPAATQPCRALTARGLAAAGAQAGRRQR